MNKLQDILANKTIKRLLVVLAATIVIVWFYPHQRNVKLFYEEGRPWNYAQLIAPFDIPIHPDSMTVERLRDTLDAHFVPIYTLDTKVVDSIVEAMPPSPYRDRAARMVRRAYDEGVVDSEVAARMRSGEIPRVRVLEKNIMSERSSQGLKSVRDIYIGFDSLISDANLKHYFAVANIHELLRPNLVFDKAENDRHYENDYQTLTADRGVILQGQAIINKGDIISPQDFTNLQTYEKLLEARLTRDSHSEWLMILGQTIYVLIVLMAMMGYFAFNNLCVYDNFKALIFTYTLVTVFFIISAVLSAFVPSGIYLVPIAIVPILVLVFFGGNTALFVAATTVMVIAPIASFSLEYIFLQASATTVAVFSLRDLTRRSQLLRTASFIVLTYIAGYLALEFLMNGTLEGFTWRMPVFLGVSALLSSMTYILMVAVEKSFGFVSDVTLVELADTNQPLLRKLSDVCPGTFQHSMSVSNLAGDAARAMGANEQLVRAGALYHDIGKMSNPAFFTENQHGVNPHDALSCNQSARIVIGHVTDGLRMADKAGLPSVIKDFISQHHGAGKAKYFYYQYCKNHPDEANPDAAPYTYPGPNPRTRETSLLMMADAVEAASRSLPDYSRESITALVNKIVDGQISEGLHADSSLEFRDVPVIKAAFVKRLMTMYHTRVAYPSAPATAAAPSSQPKQ